MIGFRPCVAGVYSWAKSSRICSVRIGWIVCQVPFERTIVSMQPFGIVPDTCAVALPGRRGESTLKGTNTSHPGNRKIICKRALGWDMLVPRRVDDTSELS